MTENTNAAVISTSVAGTRSMISASTGFRLIAEKPKISREQFPHVEEELDVQRLVEPHLLAQAVHLLRRYLRRPAVEVRDRVAGGAWMIRKLITITKKMSGMDWSRRLST